MTQKIAINITRRIFFFLLAFVAQLISQTWQDLGLKDEWIYTVDCNPQNPDVIYAGSYSGNLYKSFDAGINWSSILTNFKTIDVSVSPNDTSIIFAAGQGTNTSSVLLKSINGGTDWQASQTGISESGYGTFVSFFPDNPDTMFAGFAVMPPTTNYHAYISSDGGINWTKLNYKFKNVYCFAFDPNNARRIYIGSSLLYSSPDAGETWNVVKDFGSAVMSLAINPDNSDEIFAATKSNGVYKSTDAGVNWSTCNDDLGNNSTNCLRINPKASNQVFAATSGGGVFLSYDYGGNWQTINSGLTNLEAIHLNLDSANDRLYCGTKDGLYRLQLNPQKISEPTEFLPQQIRLLPPYPNPFNACIILPFELQNPADVQIKIFDLGGHPIQDIDAKHQPAGYGNLYWNGRNNSGKTSPSGVYFYRIVCDGVTAGFQKIIFIK